MTLSIKKLTLIGAAGLTLSGCGYPFYDTAPQPAAAPAAVAPAPVVQSRAVATPTVEEEEVKPRRTWTTGHVPTGNDNTSDGGSSPSSPSDGDDDGGWS